jgi:integrase
MERLDAHDLREANRKAAGLRAQWLQTFENQRKGLNPNPLEAITPELSSLLAQQVRHSILAGDERRRTERQDYPEIAQGLKELRMIPGSASEAPIGPLQGIPGEFRQWISNLNETFEKSAIGRMLADDLASILKPVQHEGKKLGLSLDENTPGIVECLRECLKAERNAWAEVRKRDRGEVVNTPIAPTPEKTTPKASTTLHDVFQLWKGKKVRSDDSLKACGRALKLFEDWSKDTPVQQITRAQGDGFRAYLQTLGTSSKTAHDRLTWVKSLLVYAYRDLELIPRQPWEGIDIEHRTENKRKPWTATELQSLFGQPLFTSYSLPKLVKAGADAAYWIPLLGIFTGSRISELAQLQLSDIDTDSPIPQLSITDEGAGQQVKTDSSIRTLPIHSELIRLGFLEYVTDMRAAGHTQVFPLIKMRTGKPGAYFSRWFNENKPEGLPDFHSFRHTVRSVLAEAGVSEPVMDRITGHKVKGSTGTRVYTHYSAEFMRQAVEQIEYPSVSLTKVYKQRQSKVKRRGHQSEELGVGLGT